MTRPLRRRLLLKAVVALALLPVGARALETVEIADGVTLIVFRHADRDAAADDLNAVGIARAAALPAALAHQKIDAIYRPGIRRNRDTVAPLAQQRGIDIETIATFGMPAMLARQPAGRAVVWVGNKDNLRRLWKKIAAPGDPPLAYGDLFIVRFGTQAPPVVVRSRFGD